MFMKRLMTLLLAVALFSLTSAYAQYEVRGTVVDTDGLTVIGATVLQQGTSNGTTTDLDGRFTLRVPSGETLLEVSYMGYKTLVIEARNAARVVLYEDTELLEEVVIIGYGTVKKSDMTGSVVAIKAEDLNRGAISSPDQMLLGKVSGLHITPATGQPGASAKIRIRGAASLNASNDPLIVIDGVPITGDGGAGMGNPLSSVNPNDIESYTVLKDASATAIYDFVGLAFDLAFKYRTPVMILSDGAIGQMMEKVELREPVRRLTDQEIAEKYGNWATVGKQPHRHGNIISSLSLEASEMEEINLRLQAKYQTIRENEVRYETLLCDDAEYMLVAFGSSARICESTVETARAKGIKMGLLRPITLFPFPEKAIQQFLPQLKGMMSVELNSGQMVEDVRLAVNGKVPVEFYGRMGGSIFSPEEVFNAFSEKFNL
jgi:2-oxoglutarate ferredoxin oxidoreductase subunit alpha